MLPSLAEQLDQLTGLLVAMTVYLVVRWAQRRWPDPPGLRRPPESPQLEEVPEDE